MAFHKQGISASELAQRNAHGNIRRISQILFGRYSFDMREDLTAPTVKKSTPNDPRPSLASYSRRRNMREDLWDDHSPTDPAFGYLNYIDELGKNGCSLPTFVSKVSPLYIEQIFLMPGQRQIRNLLLKIQNRYENSIDLAIKRLTEDIHEAMASGDNDTNEWETERDQARLLKPTLSLLHSLLGYSFAGGDVNGVMNLRCQPDVYPPEVIAHDWSTIQNRWKQPPKPNIIAKSADGLSTKEIRRQEAINRYQKARSAFEQLKNTRSKSEIAAAEQRRIEREKKERIEEENRQEAIRQARLAAEKAERAHILERQRQEAADKLERERSEQARIAELARREAESRAAKKKKPKPEKRAQNIKPAQSIQIEKTATESEIAGEKTKYITPRRKMRQWKETGKRAKTPKPP